MLKISAVSYLNTVPFIHGLKQSVLIHSIGLQLDYPSICADKLINGIVDLALVPVAVIPKLLQAHIISDYCIGANGAVDTVCLYSDVPITEIESIALDYQSRTSVALLKILLKEYWQLNPELKKADVGFEENIKGSIDIGKYADFTVFSQNIITVPNNQLLNTKIQYTIINGKIEYKAN